MSNAFSLVHKWLLEQTHVTSRVQARGRLGRNTHPDGVNFVLETPQKYWLITQEAMAPSRHDWKVVDWDVKPQHNQPKSPWKALGAKTTLPAISYSRYLYWQLYWKQNANICHKQTWNSQTTWQNTFKRCSHYFGVKCCLQKCEENILYSNVICFRDFGSC